MDRSVRNWETSIGMWMIPTALFLFFPMAPVQAQVISVLSPAYGSDVSGTVTIRLKAPGMKGLRARCWHQPDALHANPLGYDARLQHSTIDANGNAKVIFPAGDYPHGPVTVILEAWGSCGGAGASGSAGRGEASGSAGRGEASGSSGGGAASGSAGRGEASGSSGGGASGSAGGGAASALRDSCFLQLYNTGGVSWMEGLSAAPAPPAARGMTVVYSDDFTSMPSISHSGAGAVYASRKPDDTEFGDAIFADREGPYDPFSQRDTYLDITTTHRPGITDPAGWGRSYTTGFISSEHTDGTGFHTDGGHAQYFECRFAVAGNPGLWPAFWTLTANGYVGHTSDSCDELDIIEGYQPWQDVYYISRHEWNYGKLHLGAKFNPGGSVAAGASICAFHTYGCLIERDTTRYYFDNVEMAGAKHATLPKTWENGSYFMINDGLRNDFITKGGGFTRYGNTGKMYVDWVRVYEAIR